MTRKGVGSRWTCCGKFPFSGFGTMSSRSPAFPPERRPNGARRSSRSCGTFSRRRASTKAKFLLTSRRDEQAWLGETPRRVEAPPMPMQERLQLAGAIAEHRGRRLADLPDLTPLLQFTQGNPLTILVTVGEALRAGIDSKERLDAFVAGLRGGEGEFRRRRGGGTHQIARRVAELWLRQRFQRRRAQETGAAAPVPGLCRRRRIARDGRSRGRVGAGGNARLDARTGRRVCSIAPPKSGF